jgi:HEPN domain-containing protein
MSGPDQTDVWLEVLGWLRVAENDRRAARICVDADPPLLDVAAFHTQQAAEKLLKGFLVLASIDFGKTHDLDKLGSAVISQFPIVAALVEVMGAWTSWNIAYRYPDIDIDNPAPEPAAETLSKAFDLIAQLARLLHALALPTDVDDAAGPP